MEKFFCFAHGGNFGKGEKLKTSFHMRKSVNIPSGFL
jgi:hypothetical protein